MDNDQYYLKCTQTLKTKLLNKTYIQILHYKNSLYSCILNKQNYFNILLTSFVKKILSDIYIHNWDYKIAFLIVNTNLPVKLENNFFLIHTL